MTFRSINPSTGEIIKEYLSTTDQEIEEIVLRSNEANDSWAATDLTGRVELLNKILALFRSEKEKIARQMATEIGKPITQAQREVERSLTYFEYYLRHAGEYIADEVSYEDDNQVDIIKYQPKGTAAIILPWNYPFMLFVWMVIPNLLVGNTVILKHSELSLGVAELISKIMSMDILPDGVFQSIIGDAPQGKELLKHQIDIICFTGSTETGKYLYKTAAEKNINVVLEMGGSNPCIIFDDYPVDKAVAMVIDKRFNNNGQYCNAIKRVMVQRSVYKEFIKLLVNKVSEFKVGNSIDKETNIGPLISEGQLNVLHDQVLDAVNLGARIEVGGEKVKNTPGFFYKPTVLTNVTGKMRAWVEETFGPVLPVISFNTENEAIQLANESKYGLGAQVLTNNMAFANRVAEKLECGMVDINDGKSSKHGNPFGGVKCSGIGRENGEWGFRDLTNIKVISRNKSTP